MSNNELSHDNEDMQSQPVEQIYARTYQLLDYFDRGMEFDKADVALETLLFTLDKNRFLWENISFINHALDSLLTYYLKISDTFAGVKHDKYCENMAIKCSDAILRLILFYPFSQIAHFLDLLIHSISKAFQSKVLLPSIANQQKCIPNNLCNPQFALEALLRVLDLLMHWTLQSSLSILKILNLGLNHTNKSIQFYSLKCLSGYQPLSLSNSWVMVKMLTTFAQKGFDSLIQVLPEADGIANDAIHAALSIVDNNAKILMGRNLVVELQNFYSIVNTKLLTSILKLIRTFIENDYSNANICASILLKIFPNYYSNEEFIQICQSIANTNQNFKRDFNYKFSQLSPEYCPALLTISPSISIKLPSLNTIKPNTLYNIYCIMKKIHVIPETLSVIGEYIHMLLFANEPEEKYVEDLIDLLPENIYSYSPQIVFKVLQINEKSLTINDDMLRYAKKTKYIPLISFIIMKDPSIVSNFTKLYESKILQSESWKYPYFPQAIIHVYPDVKHLFLTRLRELLRSKKQFITIMMSISKEPGLWKIFLKFTLKQLLSDQLSDNAMAICVLNNITNFKSIYEEYPHYFSKYLFLLLRSPNKIHQYDGCLKLFGFGTTLTTFKGQIIPRLVIKNQDISVFEFLVQKIVPDVSKENMVDVIKKTVEESILDIYTYLFIYGSDTDIRNTTMFIKQKFNLSASALILDNHFKILCNLLLFAHHSNPKIKKNAYDRMMIAFKLKKIALNQDMLKEYWDRYLMATIIQYSRILVEKNAMKKILVVDTLNNCVGYIAPYVQNYFPKIFTVIDIGLRDVMLRERCITFWEKILEKIDPTILGLIFNNIISQIYPYFHDYPDKVGSVFRKLIIDSSEYTKQYFAEIAHISLFSDDNSKLPDVKAAIQNAVNSMSWYERIKKLHQQLDSAPPPFRKLLLRQLLLSLREHIGDLMTIPQDDIVLLTQNLWSVVLRDHTPQHRILCARCMSLLPYIKGISMPELIISSKDDLDLLMRTLITDFLVQSLEDATSIMCHDHAAIAIQQLLIELGCNDENDLRDNWEKFSTKYQTIISPFRTSRYKLIESPKPIETEKYDTNNWLSNFTLSLLNAAKTYVKCPKFFDCVKSVVFDSPLICKFILPYLFRFNIDNQRSMNAMFMEIFKTEIQKFITLMDIKEDTQSKEYSKQVMQILFSIFDSLYNMNITITAVQRVADWNSTNLATEYQLAKAAYECELYFRALQHLENEIRDNGTNSAMLQKLFIEIYNHLDDPDGIDYINHGLNNQFDLNYDQECKLICQSLSTAKSPISYIERIYQKGAYEQALEFSLTTKRSQEKSLELDAMISNIAVRLFKWDAIAPIPDYNDPPPNLRASAFDITLARILYNVHTGDGVSFHKEINKARDMLLPDFAAASMVSYFRMIPFLVRYRLLDDIHQSTRKNSNGIIQLKPWENEIPLKPNDMEAITSARCALINCIESDQRVAYKQISSQILQLEKFYRKSGNYEASNIALLRGRKFLIKDKDDYDLEAAKSYWGNHEQEKALHALEIIRSDDLLITGKIKYLNAKWSAELSVEPEIVFRQFNDAASQLVDSGKAYLALATIADERIAGHIEKVEQIINESKGKTESRIPRRTYKTFWNNSSPPAAVTEFLRTNIPIALENYINALVYTPQYSHEIVPRILMLYFDTGSYFVNDSSQNETFNPFSNLSTNQKDQILRDMKDTMNKKIQKVRSEVWINALTQLISRVVQPKPLEEMLFQLIKLAFQAYPHQALWHLMSVRHSTSDLRPQKFEMIWEYCKKDFLNHDQIKKEELRSKFLVVTSKLIDLVEQQVTHVKKGEIHINMIAEKLNILNEFENCQLLVPLSSTLIFQSNQTPIEPQMTISKFDPIVTILGSKTKPKKISFIANNGSHYHYLLKKDDDLRKDMRMMEFCSFVNKNLSRDRRCRQRDLMITVFAVICLNEKCGMIEWVENSSNFRLIVEKYLKEKKQGLQVNILRELLFDGITENPQLYNPKRQENFVKEVLPHYPPVMHLWFFTQFRDASRWFQARMTYSRSLAVWSMIGYFLGLGDRHSENILFNVKNATCIHVDFSYLFDKAKSLPVPEQVPFRLTHNLVDAMGLLGTNGAFNATCIIFMETMRKMKSKLVSVLQTFVHDPLLEWKVRQNAETEAAKTLQEVERRIMGEAEMEKRIESEKTVVDKLIKKATDNNNLALMYVGWQPFY